ncbi:hypothetical protein EMIT0111MI5_70162 [Burkholderia sp. IT-111MI5]
MRSQDEKVLSVYPQQTNRQRIAKRAANYPNRRSHYRKTIASAMLCAPVRKTSINREMLVSESPFPDTTGL